MLNELDMLENKVAHVVSLCRALRSENNLLRQQLASAESDKIRLTERMEKARERVEQLAQRLPEGPDA